VCACSDELKITKSKSLKTNNMKATYKVLAKINVELFYAVTIYERSITLQGDITSETIRYFIKHHDAPSWDVRENGWMSTSFEIDGVTVSVTLT
jgi:hypothetical protein